MRAGITEKRLKNRRFRRNEDAILRVFFEENPYISLKQMAKKAGVARSTVYRHHGAVREIVPDYEKYVMMRYRRTVRKMIRKKLPLKQIYFQILLFILANRQVFILLLRNKDLTVLLWMVDELKLKIEKTVRLPRKADRVFEVYKREVVFLIEEWMKVGFDGKRVEGVLDDVMYLTETMKVRLGPLKGEK